MDEGASYENNRITRISTSKTKKVINLQIVQSSMYTQCVHFRLHVA